MQLMGYATILWDYLTKVDLITPVDYPRIAIGLGSYDLRVAEYCASLYNHNLVQRILFTGNSGNWTSGKFSDTEAERFATVAIANGVPEEKISLETNATNIGENIKFTKQMLSEISDHFDEIILVTKPNTTRRAYATFAAQWPTQRFITAAPAYTINNPAHGFTTSDLIHELVGDMERIIRYPSLGFQIKQEIPDLVMQAYIYLRSQGFTQHCQT